MTNISSYLGNQMGNTEYEGGFNPLPAGDYIIQAEESTIKDTRDRTGKFLAVKFKVVDGEYQGRVFFSNYTLMNRSAQAVAIARDQISSWQKAVGIPGNELVQDSSQLHFKPFKAKVGMRTKDGFSNNTIDKYEPSPYQQAAPPVGQNQFAQQAPPQSAPAQPPAAQTMATPQVSQPPVQQQPQQPAPSFGTGTATAAWGG